MNGEHLIDTSLIEKKYNKTRLDKTKPDIKFEYV